LKITSRRASHDNNWDSKIIHINEVFG
ncbi:unnamed protein product, partial [Rotaria magnacalcarata]